MALLPLALSKTIWGAHACSVQALAFGLCELLCRAARKSVPLRWNARRCESSSPRNAETSTLQACARQTLIVRLTASSTLLLWMAVSSIAQESPSPLPSRSPSKTRSVLISFLPPPLEGSISLGIYDTKGKLVRVLHREADFDEFEVGSDALKTTWDGKNDAGESLPPGKYHARGYAVGDLKVEGVGFFFNDWVQSDDSPHIERIENFARNTEESLVLLARLAGGKNTIIGCDLHGRILDGSAVGENEDKDFYDFISPERRNLRVESGKLFLSVVTNETEAQWPELNAPRDASYSRDGNVWVIDTTSGDDSASEVKEFSDSGEFLRRLTLAPDEPAPRLIRTSPRDDRLFLLEENATVQRMRALTWVETKRENGRPVSDWKVEFEKRITVHKDFNVAEGKPVVLGGNAPPERLQIKLQSNPLQNDDRSSVELAVGSDEAGSFLKTADGLPLESISETPHLTRAVLSPHSERSIDVFQDDGAVVEQFRVSGLDQMMAFDCGAFDLN